MSAPRRVWATLEDGRVVVYVATGPTPWRWQLTPADAEELRASLGELRSTTPPAAPATPPTEPPRRSR